MKNNKIIIFIIFLMLFALGFFTCNILTVPKSVDTCKDEKKEAKIVSEKKEFDIDDKIEELRKKENIVFLGDSITDFYPIEDIYLDLPIINSGISGYKTTNILEKMDEMVYRYNPTKVFILIGTNDLNFTDTEPVEKNIVQIIENIKKNRKNTKIYIESIYPVNKSVNDRTVENRTNENIKKVNEYIKKYCEDNKYTYIDMYSILEDKDGNLDKKYTADGLHVNNLGYARISQELVKYIYNIKA